MESSVSCYVNKKLYPHLLLIPAVAVVSVLAFLNKRRSFKTDVWGGRPGLVIPLDFLGGDQNRLAISAIFAVAAGLILNVVIGDAFGAFESKWVKALVTIGYALEVAMLFYPFFGCLTTEHKLVGSIVGLFYSVLWCTLDMLSTFDRCRGLSGSEFVPTIVIKISSMVCYIFILGRFCTVIFIEGRRRISWTEENEHLNMNNTSRVDYTKPWLIQHVQGVLNPRPYHVPEARWIRFLRLIYSPKSNFCFSAPTVSIVVVCCIMVYQGTVNLVIIGYKYMKMKNNVLPIASEHCNQLNVVNAFGGSLLASTLIVALVCVLSIVRFMECHKNNMLWIFKGDTSFIPRGLERSQLMVGKCLKYAGYQIGYFLWGYILLLFVSIIFTSLLSVIIYCDIVRSMLQPIVAYMVPFLCFTLPLWLVLVVSSLTIFRERSFRKDAIAVDNRNVYLVFSYFYFFLGLPVGFFSAILRLLKAIPIGFFMLPRVDQSVMLDGFQRFDNGFAAYVCYLHVQAAHRNPVLRVFCQIVHNEMRKTLVEKSFQHISLMATKKYRNKWFLLVTLLRNPQLRGYRKHVIAPPVVRYVNDVDMLVELPCIQARMQTLID